MHRGVSAVKVAVYPGSFDPITCGHLDVIERSSKLFDRLIVTVFRNPSKNHMFSMEERVEMVREATAHLKNVEVDCFDGLLIEYAASKNADVIIKGLRAVSDFLYEFQMALVNKKLEPGIETVFVMTSPQYSYLSSSMVRELAGFGACVKGLVPPNVERRLKARFC